MAQPMTPPPTMITSVVVSIAFSSKLLKDFCSGNKRRAISSGTSQLYFEACMVFPVASVSTIVAPSPSWSNPSLYSWSWSSNSCPLLMPCVPVLGRIVPGMYTSMFTGNCIWSDAGSPACSGCSPFDLSNTSPLFLVAIWSSTWSWITHEGILDISRPALLSIMIACV